MKIGYIDGNRLRRALIVGAERLMERAAQLNAINVFPVPDGDTGTNMASTARSIAIALRHSGPLPLGSSLRTAADSALAGARGNSGAILAQFIQGLAEELGEEIRITTRRFAGALRAASARTRAALGKPREGTIITLLDDWALAAEKEAAASDDFLVVLGRAHDAAEASLARTTELLPELKKAGVVDAGAQGFFHVLEGIMAFIAGGRLRDIGARFRHPGPSTERAASAEAQAATVVTADAMSPEAGHPGLEASVLAAAGEAGNYRFCTEFFANALSETGAIDLPSLRAALESLGDSLVVAGSSRRLRVHIHTNRPSVVFRLASSFGELSAMKVDDMELQRRIVARSGRTCALLIDSAVDLPDDERLELLVERVPVQVELAGRRWLDRDGLRPEEFVSLLHAMPSAQPSTSQPSPADFARKFDLLLASAREVVYVGIAEVLSGTLEGGRRSGAERARAAGKPGAVSVLDSRSISVGAALVARRAAQAAAAGADGAAVLRVAKEAAAACRLLVAVPELAGLIRSGRLGAVKGLVLRAFGLRPLLGLDKEGRPIAVGLYAGARRGIPAILASLARSLPRGRGIEALVAHVDAPESASALAKAIEKGWKTRGPVKVTSVCPALAAHAGLGALVLAYLPTAPGGEG
ncbi:MAG TPA: DegV family protein [Rectinemataceae bacterium]|nr:DegV family protein [Rectinemataceae bacterium]